MKVYLLYTLHSPEEREVAHYARRLERLQVEVSLVDADSREGQSLTELYDLTARPSAVLATLDGTMVERWQTTLPAPEDISYLAHN